MGIMNTDYLTSKQCKADIMELIRERIALENDGWCTAVRDTPEDTVLRLARMGVSIDLNGSVVTAQGRPIYRINRRFSSRRTHLCYRELMPTLELV